ncbi:MAG: hypothetical protein DRN33_04575 [Thermoplasmata archaeon]|nr:MAG: hypothetical protein DRN33_04575 [Thermoplasmata archaeon]
MKTTLIPTPSTTIMENQVSKMTDIQFGRLLDKHTEYGGQLIQTYANLRYKGDTDNAIQSLTSLTKKTKTTMKAEVKANSILLAIEQTKQLEAEQTEKAKRAELEGTHFKKNLSFPQKSVNVNLREIIPTLPDSTIVELYNLPIAPSEEAIKNDPKRYKNYNHDQAVIDTTYKNGTLLEVALLLDGGITQTNIRLIKSVFAKVKGIEKWEDSKAIAYVCKQYIPNDSKPSDELLATDNPTLEELIELDKERIAENERLAKVAQELADEKAEREEEKNKALREAEAEKNKLAKEAQAKKAKARAEAKAVEKAKEAIALAKAQAEEADRLAEEAIALAKKAKEAYKAKALALAKEAEAHRVAKEAKLKKDAKALEEANKLEAEAEAEAEEAEEAEEVAKEKVRLAKARANISSSDEIAQLREENKRLKTEITELKRVRPTEQAKRLNAFIEALTNGLSQYTHLKARMTQDEQMRLDVVLGGADSPYDILGISPDATKEEIKKAYKTLVKAYHPDTSEGNEEQFQEILDAYERIK